MRTIDAVTAVRNGASVAATARQFGINRSTLERWLARFDPDHPIASLRPKRRGPKGPRPEREDRDDDLYASVIRQLPAWWGKRRIAEALRGQGITLSEATIGRILARARQQTEVARQRHARQKIVVQRRADRVAARRLRKDIARRELWQQRLIEAGVMLPNLPAAERCRRIAEALAKKGWRMQVKDLTPELEQIAYWYVLSFQGWDEEWLVHVARRFREDGYPSQLVADPVRATHWPLRSVGPNRDHDIVAALNNLVKTYRGPAVLPEPNNLGSDAAHIEDRRPTISGIFPKPVSFGHLGSPLIGISQR